MIDDVWLPAAIRFGIPITEFWILNPKYMSMYQEDYIQRKEEELKMIDISAYYNGIYNYHALACNLSKKAKYPKKPFSIEKSEKKRLENMTEEEYVNEMKNVIAKMNGNIKN